MTVRLLTSDAELQAYDAWVKTHPQGSLWQSLEWKKYQEALGRQTRVYGALEGSAIVASALVIIDRTVGGLSTWDVPRGPLVASSLKLQASSFIEKILENAKKDKCLSVYVSPETPLETRNSKLVTSTRCEQSPATRIIDISKTHDEILTQMHQKGRYNIKVAQKHDVQIQQGKAEDIDAFYELLRHTSKRDVFGISPKSHYTKFLSNLDDSFFLLAMHEKKTVAGLLGVMWNGTGFYYYGASDHEKRALMAPYLLQWEAMKLCKEKGCERYDLLGIAPPDSGPDHHWSGISSFKEKFGGTVVTYPPEQQIILRPYTNVLLQWKRKVFG